MSVNSPYTEEFHQSLKEGSRRSAREIVPLVLGLIQPISVVDVGCGLGTWLSVFKDFGIRDCLGIDGDYIDKNILEILAEEFHSYDLKSALQINRHFDLVVSVEVAEHLPVEYARTFIDSLTSLGPVVLFSAAIPLQRGIYHVNVQWPEYWAHQFQNRGYQVIDCLRKQLWNNEYVEPWYAQNILIFVRHDCLERYPLLQRAPRTDLSQLAMVHPKISRHRSVETPPDRQAGPSGVLHAVRIEITEPISDIVLQAPAERLKCAVELEGTPIGTLELPVCDGLVSGYVLADAIAAEYAWSILGRFFEATVYRELKIKTDANGLSAVWRGDLRLTEKLADPRDELSECIHNRAGWTVFLQELWGHPYWPQQRFYESQPEEEGSAQHSVENDCISIEVSQDIPDITIVGPELHVVLEVGGAPLGMVMVPVEQNKASAQELRAALTRAGGLELCRVAVREGLLGRPLEAQARLRDRLAAAAATKPRQDGQAHFLKRALLPATHGVVLGRRAQETIGTSASRRAVLPSHATQDVVATAVAAGEPVISILGPRGNPARLVYAPDVICRPSEQRRPSPTSGGVLQAIPKRVPSQNAISAPILTDQIPILLYRRVTPGRGRIKSYDPVTLDAFREHLEYLHDAGFYSIGLGDWRAALERQTPLSRRAVIFTFDGYLDFLTHAWPVLKHYGFSAMLSLVTDKIGRSSTWDPNYGEAIPVLGWEEIRDLQKEGVEFGSHSASYRPLTSLPLVEVVREAARSRAILEDRLGTPIQTFSYPYGDCDRVVQQLIGACGYIFGLSSRGGPSRFWDSLLDLPRIEITGSDSFQDFVVKVDSKQAVALK